MAAKKRKSVVDEPKKEYKGYQQTEQEQEICKAVFKKFRDTALSRDRNFENFDGLNLIDYIDDSVHRFTTNIDEREGIEDWQARVHNQMTRNKVLAILSKVVQNLPIAEMQPRGEEDHRRAQILSNLYEYSEDVDDYELLMTNIVLEGIVKGTAIGYEGYEHKETLVREIVSGTADDIRVDEKIKKTNRLYGQIVRLEDFYPSSVTVSSIKKMPFCFWRETMPFSQFEQDYAMYNNAKLVEPHQASMVGVEDHPPYLDYISNDVGDGDVEVIKYYNKETDEFIIIANYIWLNPIIVDGTSVTSPIPFNHKELPFWDIKNELFDATFFYGKSLPDKLKSLQDVANVLNNMLLDQSFLTVFKPLLTNGFDSMEDDYLRPGRRTPVDTQGLSIKEAVMEMDMSTPSGWHQFIMEYTKKTMEEASIDQVSSGQAGAGDRTTAQEIRLAAEGVAALLGILGRFVKNGIKRKAELRVKNIMQFYSDKNNPIVQMVGGEDGNKDFNEAFNFFKFNDSVMSDGRRGGKIIEMYKDRQSLPGKETLKARSDIHKMSTGKDVEIIAIPGEYIMNADVDVVIVQNPKSEQTRDMDKAMQLEKVKVYMSFFPNVVDMNELAAQTMEIMGDDPTILMKEDIFAPKPEAAQGQQMQPMSQAPSANMTDNMMRGAMGGEMKLNDMQMK
jgi:hypothetical protein